MENILFLQLSIAKVDFYGFSEEHKIMHHDRILKGWLRFPAKIERPCHTGKKLSVTDFLNTTNPPVVDNDHSFTFSVTVPLELSLLNPLFTHLIRKMLESETSSKSSDCE